MTPYTVKEQIMYEIKNSGLFEKNMMMWVALFKKTETDDYILYCSHAILDGFIMDRFMKYFETDNEKISHEFLELEDFYAGKNYGYLRDQLDKEIANDQSPDIYLLIPDWVLEMDLEAFKVLMRLK